MLFTWCRFHPSSVTAKKAHEKKKPERRKAEARTKKKISFTTTTVFIQINFFPFNIFTIRKKKSIGKKSFAFIVACTASMMLATWGKESEQKKRLQWKWWRKKKKNAEPRSIGEKNYPFRQDGSFDYLSIQMSRSLYLFLSSLFI